MRLPTPLVVKLVPMALSVPEPLAATAICRAGATAEAAGSAVQSDRVAAGKAQSTVIRQRRGRLDQDGDVGPNAHVAPEATAKLPGKT